MGDQFWSQQDALFLLGNTGTKGLSYANKKTKTKSRRDKSQESLGGC